MKKKVLADRYLKMFKSIALGVILSTAGTSAVFAADRPADADNFYRSDKVEVQKVTFKNQYKMNIAGNLYLPKDMDKSKKHAAIIVGHPMGAAGKADAAGKSAVAGVGGSCEGFVLIGVFSVQYRWQLSPTRQTAR